MYINNLKNLRNDSELTQDYIAKHLKVKRSTYATWENGYIMIPIEKADELSMFYKVKLSYILGIDKKVINCESIKKMNYKTLLKKLNQLKKENNNTFQEIATYLNCNRSTCQRYFKGVFTIPIDRLLLLSELYNIEIDKLCGKE